MSIPEGSGPLCSICNLVLPKYCCPRCPGPVRTCSLPCYKRHQSRASCNGKRDPAAYIKKSALATPSAIDRDYNFLTGLQNKLEDATDSTSQADGGANHGQYTPNARRQRSAPDSRFNQYLYENRITINRAPTGMSRQKSNQSRYLPKSKKIVWTVEWLDAIGSPAMLVETPSDATVAESYALASKEQQKLDKKRKRYTEHAPGQVKSVISVVAETSNARDETMSSGAIELKSSDSKPISATDRHTDSTVPADTDPRATLDVPSVEEAKLSPTKHYYLLRPRTSTRNQVLIPINATDTLTTSLTSRIVLEYPTFFAIEHSEGDLPPGFMLEKDYLVSRQAQLAAQREREQKVSLTSQEARNGSQNEALDAGAILDMLRRDTSLR